MDSSTLDKCNRRCNRKNNNNLVADGDQRTFTGNYRSGHHSRQLYQAHRFIESMVGSSPLH